MATYVILLDYTEQGIRNVKESPQRSEALAGVAQRFGAKVKDIYWTSGAHDGLLVLEAPDDATAAKITLTLGGLGNVRTQTLRAYGRSEMESILSGID
jgi:uncharacterized protein with GYD domain